MNFVSGKPGVVIGANTQREQSPPIGQRRLRVAVLNRNFSPTAGGAERLSIAHVEQLAPRHDIHVFAQTLAHAIPGVTFHKVSTSPFMWRWTNQLWYATAAWWATRHGFDVIHSHENIWCGNVQTVTVLPSKYKLFYGVSGPRLLLSWLKVLTSPRWITYLWLEKKRFAIGQKKKRITATSDILLQQMSSVYPDSAHVFEVVTPGVTMPSEVATPQRQLAARKQLGLPQTGRGILFVGNDYGKKGLNTLLKSLAKFHDNTWLAVVGSPAHIPEFQGRAKAEGVADRVHFLGSIKDTGPAYVAVDCLAHPTLEDTFAMVVVESMANGVPVVVSGKKFCGISALLTHETNVLLVEDPRNADALHAALARVFEDDVLRQKLCAAGLQFAAKYQWSAISLQQEKIYFEVAQS